MKKRIYKLLFLTLLAGVYGGFFSVELFHNFEWQTNGRSVGQIQSSVNHPVKDGKTDQFSSSHSSFSHGVRLNKRYYQQDATLCPVLAPQAPFLLLAPLVLGTHRSADLSDLAAAIPPLRGPPAIG